MDDLRTHARSKINLPCAACRMLRRKCSDKCILAPYFPADEPANFVSVHKVFGASNVTKMLQMVEEAKREDAVKSIVYEANARLKDPVYGSSGTVFQLQKQLQNLVVQLDLTRTQVLESQQQRDHLLRTLIDIHPLLQISSIDHVLFDRADDDTLMGFDSTAFPINCERPALEKVGLQRTLSNEDNMEGMPK